MADQGPTHGKFCWNELMTRDVPKAQTFYTELLGWKATDSGMEGMDYTIFKCKDDSAGGMMAMPKEVPTDVPSHWMAYITVDDVDGLSQKTSDLGGQVLVPPQDIPNMGRFCIIQDPTGAAVGLIKFNQ